jgi:adenylate cyclase
MQQTRRSGVQSFLAELKRRKVFRVAAAYGAAAFVAIQVADLIFPRLGLPDWTITLVVGLCLVGFPIAIVLAWVFETGPDGLKRTGPAAEGELASIVSLPRARRWSAGFGAIAGIALLAGGAWWSVGRDGIGARAYDSIAVLPFANLSGETQDEYFGDGLAEELLNALSGIEGLRVAARTSAFAFKGLNADVRTIGDTLGVAAVLEGSVRRSAERIRITATLIDTRTGYQLWSEAYDRPLTELFTLQAAIASEIVDALAIRLAGRSAEDGLYRGGTADLEAYDLYLLGRQKWATRDMTQLREALGHFEQAIARDSSFALAWSGFADVIDALAWRRDADALARLEEGAYAAQRAIVLDPDLAEGWASLGVLRLDFDRDWRFAELALRRTLELKPSYAVAHDWLSDALLYQGRLEESLEVRQHARTLDPISGVGMYHQALALGRLDRWEEARQIFLRLQALGWTNTNHPLFAVKQARSLGFGAMEAADYARQWAAGIGYADPDAAAVIGRAVFAVELRNEARTVLRRIEESGAAATEIAGALVALEDPEGALRMLERAEEQGDPQLISVLVDPTFEVLRGEARFERIVQGLGRTHR